MGLKPISSKGLVSATKDKPIVMGAVTDQVGANLVKRKKPGESNITGVSDHNPTGVTVEIDQRGLERENNASSNSTSESNSVNLK